MGEKGREEGEGEDGERRIKRVGVEEIRRIGVMEEGSEREGDRGDGGREREGGGDEERRGGKRVKTEIKRVGGEGGKRGMLTSI